MRNSTPRSRSGSPDDGLTPPQRRYEQPQYDQSDAQQQGMIDLARNAGRRDSNASSGSGPASNAESAAGGGNVAQAYLGRMLNVDSHASLHDVEISNRIAAAWRKFWALSRELTSTKFSLRSRLRLFDSTVTASLFVR